MSQSNHSDRTKLVPIKQLASRIRASIQKILCCQIPWRYLHNVHYPHPVGIVIGDGVRIGRNVRIYQNVTIGLIQNTVGATTQQYPTIEDDVSIYAGAVIAGGITIGARTIVGANAVITKSVPADSVAFGFNKTRAPRHPSHDAFSR